MARVTKTELEAQIAELLLTVGALRSRIVELEDTLEAKNLRAQAAAHADMRAEQAPKLALVTPTPKAAAQAAAKAAAMATGRCTRVVQFPQGDWGFEFYGRKAA